MISGHLQIKNGYYYVVLSYRDSAGKRKQPWIKTGLPVKGNKKRAEQLLAEYRNNYVPPIEKASEGDLSENMLFSDFMEMWLDIIATQVQPTTFGSYELIIVNSIIPYFKELGVSIAELKPRQLQSYYNMLNKRVAPATVIRHHQVIHKALKYLVKIDVLATNPSDKVELPKKPKILPNYYRKEDLEKLFEVSKNHQIGMIIQLAAFYGLRRGEVMGLKWNAFDFENNTFSIRHTITTARVHGKSVLVQADRAKTSSSLRTLPLVNSIKEELLALKAKQEYNKKLCGNSYNHSNDEYLFVNQIGDLLKPDSVSRQFQKILSDNGLRHIRFHDLRHSCASLLVSNNVPMKMVQEWLGHSDMGTTANIYSHLDFSSKVASARVMDSLLQLPGQEKTAKQA